MQQFLSFILKEAKHILRDRRTMLMLFALPLVMMLLFGFAVTNDVKNVRTLVVTSTLTPATAVATERLAQSEYFQLVGTVSTPAEAERSMRAQKADMTVVFSSDFSEERGGGVQFMVDGSDPNMSQQWTNYAQQVMSNPAHALVNVKMLYNPQMKSAYNFVPGIMGMLLMLICAMMTSVSIVREKEKGTMEVLLVSPTPPLLIVVAKVIPYLVLAFGILTAILLVSTFVLGVPLSGSLAAIFGISALYILLALSLGLLVSNVVQTQLAALLGSAMVLLMPILMFSGMMFPIESMPIGFQWFSALIPTRYFITAMRKLMIMGVGIEEVMHEILILLGMLLALLTLAIATFKQRLE